MNTYFKQIDRNSVYGSEGCNATQDQLLISLSEVFASEVKTYLRSSVCHSVWRVVESPLMFLYAATLHLKSIPRSKNMVGYRDSFTSV